VTAPSRFRKALPAPARQSILQSFLLVATIVGALAAGCTATDPRSDDSDVFGSASPSVAAPSATP
jgi:hypothetical protein